MNSEAALGSEWLRDLILPVVAEITNEPTCSHDMAMLEEIRNAWCILLGNKLIGKIYSSFVIETFPK